MTACNYPIDPCPCGWCLVPRECQCSHLSRRPGRWPGVGLMNPTQYVVDQTVQDIQRDRQAHSVTEKSK